MLVAVVMLAGLALALTALLLAAARLVPGDDGGAVSQVAIERAKTRRDGSAKPQ